jgi:hypothetical protein
MARDIVHPRGRRPPISLLLRDIMQPAMHQLGIWTVEVQFAHIPSQPKLQSTRLHF